MAKRTLTHLQKSGSTKRIPPNGLVAQNSGINSPSPSIEESDSFSQQDSKSKKTTRSTKREDNNNDNNIDSLKSEESSINNNNHEQKDAAAPKTSYTIHKGLKVDLNDHVYLAQSDSNVPHRIGRVTKFIKNGKDIQVKVVVYYRKKDLMDGFSNEVDEPRKLYASFYCEKFHLRAIQGKCTVIHLNYINEISSYVKLDDHFYFDELYDDFSTNSYKLIPTDKITNMQEPYISILREKYHFIATEHTQTSEYLKEFQECRFCNEWCSEQERIECSSCEKLYHKKCMATPVGKQPLKGYIYECIDCYGNAREELEELRAQNTFEDKKSVKSEDSDKSAIKLKDISHKEKSIIGSQLSIIKDYTSVYINEPLRCTEDWIYRYFGKNSYLEDLEDLYDSIYPRIDRRVGPKYQAKIPELISNPTANIYQSQNHHSQHTKKKNRKLRYIPLESSDPIFEVKSSSQEVKINTTMDLIRSQPEEFAIPIYSEAFFNELIILLNKALSPKAVVEKLKSFDISDFQSYLSFTKNEQLELENQISKYGEDIEKIAESFSNRSLSNTIEYFYKWASKIVGNKINPVKYHSGKLRHIAKIITHGIEPVYIDEIKDAAKLTKTRSSAPSNSSCSHCQSNLEKLAYQLSAEVMEKLNISGDLCSKCYSYYTKYFELPPISDESITLNEENSIKNIIAPKKKSYEHDKANSASIAEEKTLLKKTELPKTSKQLKPNLTKSQIGSNLLNKNISLSPIDCCAFDNNLILSKSLKSLELALPSPNTAMKNSMPLSASAQSLIEESHLNYHNNEKLTGKKSDTNTHTSIMPKPNISSSCSICYSKQNPEQIMKCCTCKTSVHKKCYLLPSDFNQPKEWKCSECLNKSDASYYQNYMCVLCRKLNFEENENFPIKPTISGNWAHIACALYLESIYFTNISRQCKISGISEVPIEDWKKECSICHKDNSLSAKCKGCEINFHVTCALHNNCEFGFKKHSNSLTGYMEPVIYCNYCKLSDILDPLEPLSNLSFFDLKDLYKKSKDKTIYSEKLFALSNCPLNSPKPISLVSEEDKESESTYSDKLGKFGLDIVDHSATVCSSCETEYSPVWWHDLYDKGYYICQSCHFKQVPPDQSSANKRKFVIKFKSQDDAYLATPDNHQDKLRKITSPY